MTTATTPKQEQVFKDTYNAALQAQNLNGVSKDLSESLLKIMFSHRVPTSFSNLTQQIAEAANRGDVDTVLKLSQDLKNVQDNERQNKKSLDELSKKFKFHDVLQAFHDEFEELAYQIASTALSKSHAMLVQHAGKKTRTPRAASADGEAGEGRKNKQSVFKITMKDGTVVDFPIVQGPKGNIDFKKAEAAYNALGFEVKVEGKEQFVEPGIIELKAGGSVPVNRSNLIEAIEKQTAEQFEGWKVEKIKLD